jgi:hypothetical protein
MSKPVRVTAVTQVDGFRVVLDFTDGTRKEINLEPYLRGPIFQPLRDDPRQFANVKVDPRLGTIVWENGADIDPDVLYQGLEPAWMSEGERSQQ